MKISTKTRYGLRALVDLAVYSETAQVPLVNIAQRQGLSVNYLEQVFSLLKKRNIVKSVKGAQGGYMLAREAHLITVGEVIRAIEGDIAIVDEENESPCESLLYANLKKCLKDEVWDKINQSICEVIDQITLEDLKRDYTGLIQTDVNMYYI